MAAIAPSSLLPGLLLIPVLVSFALAADQPHEVLQTINHVTSALTSGNPADAITPFDKSFAGYDTLQKEFVGLTEAYQVTNEADVLEERDSPTESELTLQWALTLTGNESKESNRKSAQVHVRLRLLKGKWKIVEFTPLDLFTP